MPAHGQNCILSLSWSVLEMDVSMDCGMDNTRMHSAQVLFLSVGAICLSRLQSGYGQHQITFCTVSLRIMSLLILVSRSDGRCQMRWFYLATLVLYWCYPSTSVRNLVFFFGKLAKARCDLFHIGNSIVKRHIQSKSKYFYSARWFALGHETIEYTSIMNLRLVRQNSHFDPSTLL